jgi:hypothetical protein
MPSRKQRRRRDKSRRHEYEYVVVDEAGKEVEVLEPDDVRRKDPKADPKAADRRRGGRRFGREVQPPSWSRVGKRALIFAPVMFIVVSLLGGKQVSLAGKILETLFLLAFFLPFSYVMDSIAYRAYRRRVERT